MDRLDAWLTAGPPELDDRDIIKWLDMLREHIPDAASALNDAMGNATDDAGLPDVRDGGRRAARLERTLTAILDHDNDEVLASLLASLDVIRPYAADCATWIDDYHQSEAEDYAAYRADWS